MDWYGVLKTAHILSGTILFGFGAGTAWYFWSAHRTRDPATVASVGRMVIRADWLFTGTSGVVQPLTGITLAHLARWPLGAPWLVATYALYALAFVCWVLVVRLQIVATRLATDAAASGTPLPTAYNRAMRWWFALGWPAFLALVIVYWLMVTKPALW